MCIVYQPARNSLLWLHCMDQMYEKTYAGLSLLHEAMEHALSGSATAIDTLWYLGYMKGPKIYEGCFLSRKTKKVEQKYHKLQRRDEILTWNEKCRRRAFLNFPVFSSFNLLDQRRDSTAFSFACLCTARRFAALASKVAGFMLWKHHGKSHLQDVGPKFHHRLTLQTPAVLLQMLSGEF